MLAKKFALGFGIAIILPMVIYYGVSIFSPSPKWRDYQVSDYYERYEDASKDEKAGLREERKQLQEERRANRKRFERHLFFVATPIGIAAIIAGSVIAIQAVGAGLMFGGIFTVTEGYVCYWSELPDWMRFLSLLLAFAILIYVGCRSLAKKE